jgi:putative transposase
MKHYLKERIMCGYGLQSIEPIDKIVLGIRISSIERSILVAEQFIQKLAIEYGKHPVYTDGGTWYPQHVNS